LNERFYKLIKRFFSDCLYLMWCVHHMLISWSFYALHALSLWFFSLMFETFLELLKLLNLLHEVQYLRFSVCEVTWLNLDVLSTCLRFLERSDWLTFFYISFIFFLFIIFIRILRFLQSNDKSSLNHCFLTVTSCLVMLIHDDDLNVKCVFSCIYNCLLKSCINVFNFCTFFMMNASWLSIFFFEMFQRC